MSATDRMVAVVGPTAVGKSSLGLRIAELVGGHILSTDSQQIYNELPIATNREDHSGVPHHLTGSVPACGANPPCTVLHFRRSAEQCIEHIRDQSAVPVLVGGTVYYAEGVLRHEFASVDATTVGTKRPRSPSDVHRETKNKVRSVASTDCSNSSSATNLPTQYALDSTSLAGHSTEQLYAMLARSAPTWALRLHPNDRRKILKALSVWSMRGKCGQGGQVRVRYPVKIVWLCCDPAVLNVRIERRVKNMIVRGLLSEVATVIVRYAKQFCGVAMCLSMHERIKSHAVRTCEQASLVCNGCKYLGRNATIRHACVHELSTNDLNADGTHGNLNECEGLDEKFKYSTIRRSASDALANEQKSLGNVGAGNSHNKMKLNANMSGTPTQTDALHILDLDEETPPSCGVFQAIGFKEMWPYFRAVYADKTNKCSRNIGCPCTLYAPPRGGRMLGLLVQCVQRMVSATTRYAKYQQRVASKRIGEVLSAASDVDVLRIDMTCVCRESVDKRSVQDCIKLCYSAQTRSETPKEIASKSSTAKRNELFENNVWKKVVDFLCPKGESKRQLDDQPQSPSHSQPPKLNPQEPKSSPPQQTQEKQSQQPEHLANREEEGKRKTPSTGYMKRVYRDCVIVNAELMPTRLPDDESKPLPTTPNAFHATSQWHKQSAVRHLPLKVPLSQPRVVPVSQFVHMVSAGDPLCKVVCTRCAGATFDLKQWTRHVKSRKHRKRTPHVWRSAE